MTFRQLFSIIAACLMAVSCGKAGIPSPGSGMGSQAGEAFRYTPRAIVPSSDLARVIAPEGLPLRLKPTEQAPVAFTLPYGAEVSVFRTKEKTRSSAGVEGRWTLVSWSHDDLTVREAIEGWVFGGYLASIAQPLDPKTFPAGFESGCIGCCWCCGGIRLYPDGRYVAQSNHCHGGGRDQVGRWARSQEVIFVCTDRPACNPLTRHDITYGPEVGFIFWRPATTNYPAVREWWKKKVERARSGDFDNLEPQK